MATATANGTLTPPSPPSLPPTSPSFAKRKRTATDAPAPNGASPPATEALLDGASPSLQTVLEDILSVLKGYDTQPSILTRPLTSSAARAASGEADSKRTKLTPPAGSTIASQLQDGSYHSFEALDKDVENATADILASIGSGELDTAPSTPEDTRLQAKVLAFRKMLKTLVHREEVRRAHVEAKKRDASIKVEDAADVKEEPLESRTVLTLFANAQGPKQLFSSLQQPRAISSEDPSSNLDTSVKVTLPLRESTLPNIISTTEVFPLADEVDEKKKANATIGKLFKAPAHLPQLSPPKLAKSLTTKGSTVTFAHPEPSKPNRKTSHSYATQPLSAGCWLGYGGVDMPKDPTSPTAKQKSRQRALSTGAGEQPPSELTLTAIKQAKDDALFRSAYSSFAPTRDNASAIIPEETKNMVWWQKVGEKRFNEVFPIDPELLGSEPSPADVEDINLDEDEVFKAAVESFEPIDEASMFETEEKSALEKNTEEVLVDISELLETLASHQRIRNSSLATNPRTPVIQNASLANLAGSPSTPSSEEVDIYQILKSQLTMMILQLPPHALAKLNGDQLEELNISRTILIENKDTRGVLEEDQATRLAKAPTAAAAPTPSLARMSSSASVSQYPNNQYGRSTPVHNSVRPVQASTSYFPQQQATHRSPSVTYPRPSSNVQPGYQTPVSTFAANPRPGVSSTYNNATYSTQTPRAAHAPAPTNQYYSHTVPRPSSYGGAAASQYHGATPQAQQYSRYPPQQAQQQNGYVPPRPPQNVAPMYSGTPSVSHVRTASPLKAAPTPIAQPNYGTRAGGFGTPVAGTHMRSTYYAPSQYGNSQPQPQPQPHTPIAAATPGYTANPQQMMLDRQQAQQPQARLAAQNSFTRGGSGTPQPGSNGQFGGQQANGTMT
ncbi:hypothetical protein P280DRAFT_498281 [Massarina eburnea CBS 473.64]|uniref:Uncharacterized protein n=1 Tax=Massarina eburnea CBS 473.64 TaxID=1395130 RepID=A0A6A6S0X0_9PLEO|nr:hypothetical protein P280DRAFT_498281 [Massarina eburnea CBS 473.64]